MPVSVTMPRLGESVTEGTVTRWLKKEGDHVEADEPLLEISTEKVDTEIPSPSSGVLRQISVTEDETVEVGAELAVIEEDGEAAAPAGVPAERPAPEPESPAPEPEPAAAESHLEPPAPPPAPPATPEQPAAEERPAPPAEERPAAEAPPPPPSPVPERPAAEQAPPQPQPAPEPGPQEPTQPAPPTPLPTATGEAPYVTPLVRKLAAEHGVDLSKVEGTGVGGRVRKQDVLEAARAQQAEREAPAQITEAPAPEPAAPAAAPAATTAAQPRPQAVPPEAAAPRGRTERMTRIRQVIAQRMVESLQVSAQLTTVVEADVTKIARLRERAKRDFEAREGVKLSFLPFFALATVEALKVHPKLNAVIDTEKNEITYHDAEHLGMAVDTERGLLVPVIRDAGDLSLVGLARKITDVAERTRSGHIQPDELSGGTFTLTNTGSRGALIDTPVINQPQVGILGTGSVVKRPVVIDDPELGEVIAVRSMIYLSLTYDHRLVDGADAARFLGTLRTRLEEGSFEAELGLL
ncbi:MAG: 2-oxoglutarate dehydrogenase, E2 component, dihydrolipoamide succinyltransferase [Streptosporangiales bacterium]|nr:2-oxoglutarate dehydrogenase, E2 component, dihydrolipoamide succinyltransferase [Streptosporangiales bacterium]